MAKFVTFEGIAFNADWVLTKTLDQFIEHEKHHGLSKEKMKEIYDAIKTPKVEKPA